MTRTALSPVPPQLGTALPLSLLLHFTVFSGVLLWDLYGGADRGPLIDPDDVMQVTAVALPKQTTALPQKEMKRPDPPSGDVREAPETPEQTSDMVQHVEEVPETRGQPTPDHSQDRRALLDQLRRQEALDAVRDAPDGPEDNLRTDPDGVEGALGQSSAQVGDPELAAYIEKIRRVLLANFSPIQTQELVTWIDIEIDKTGKIVDWDTRAQSGNASYDAAALRAVMKTRRVPPPPEKYLSQALAGLSIRFANH